MKALTRDRYGTPDVLEWKEKDAPDVPDDGIVVRVRAASINPAERYDMTGTPLLMRVRGGWRRPKDPLMGGDIAGVVEAVGPDIEDVSPGDEVFGRTGELGELSPAMKFAGKPGGLRFEEAAAIPVAGITALQGLRDHGGLDAGQHVLVNGASGGVGTFAVQIAKALGAEVTAVCSTQNVETARSLGADHVVDYTKEDFTASDARYDVILDIAGSRPWKESKRVLKPEGVHVLIGAPKAGPFLGPLGHILATKLASMRGSRRFVFFVAKLNPSDLALLGAWAAEGKVKPVIDRTYSLEQVADAFRYLDEGHARGKIVVSFG